jgi:hypothetical protein
MPFTLRDIQALRDLMVSVFDERFEIKIAEKLKNLPTKDEYYSRMDALMSELKAKS